jgi:hypothetical protein
MVISNKLAKEILVLKEHQVEEALKVLVAELIHKTTLELATATSESALFHNQGKLAFLLELKDIPQRIRDALEEDRKEIYG